MGAGGKSGKQAPGTSDIVEVGRGVIDEQQQAKRIHEDVAFAAFDTFMSIKPADPGGFLDRFHADAASMIAQSAAYFCRRPQSALRRAESRPTPGPEDRVSAGNDRRLFAKAES